MGLFKKKSGWNPQHGQVRYKIVYLQVYGEPCRRQPRMIDEDQRDKRGCIAVRDRESAVGVEKSLGVWGDWLWGFGALPIG